MNTDRILLVSAFGLILLLETLQTLQTNNIMNSSKTEVKELGSNMIEAVKNGEADALPELIETKKNIELLKAYEEELKPFAIQEREMYPDKRLPMNGAYVELSYSGDRLNYDDDPIYKQLNEALKNRVKELKEAYKCEHTIVDCEGVVIPKVGVKTHGKQIIKISY